MLLTQQHLPVMCEISCDFLSSSETMCQLNECAQPLCQNSEMGDTHVYFIRPVAYAPETAPIKLQNLHKNSAAGLSLKNLQRERTDIILWLAWLLAMHQCINIEVEPQNFGELP